jgi:AcrR family transcriptional regulator
MSSGFTAPQTSLPGVPSVTRRKGGTRTRRGAAESEIFAAVERLLARGESYTALGMQAIADEAGVARSTMYVHFTDKADLLMRLAESATGDLFGAAEHWIVGAGDLEALERTEAAIIAQQREHAGLFRALAEVAGYDPAVARFWRSRVDAVADLLHERLAGRDLDPVVTARFLVWATERTVFEHVADSGGVDDEQLAKGMAQIIWRVMNP